jgi:hypothetical protein
MKGLLPITPELSAFANVARVREVYDTVRGRDGKSLSPEMIGALNGVVALDAWLGSSWRRPAAGSS